MYLTVEQIEALSHKLRFEIARLEKMERLPPDELGLRTLIAQHETNLLLAEVALLLAAAALPKDTVGLPR